MAMIETERLTLRPHRLADYAAYLSLFRHAEVHRFIGGAPLSPEEAWNKILGFAGHWALLGYGLFGVFERAGGAYIGVVGIADFKRGIGDHFDIGREGAWVFSPAYHGHGYAFEAAKAAHRWFEANHGEGRIVCLIHPQNRASLNLAERLGYRAFSEAEYKNGPVVLLERAGN